ncbi:MAG: TerC family protein [Fimbriimonadaceae bacterium]|nr:TerC family protein [Fimbriimonadaceae bacterium]
MNTVLVSSGVPAWLWLAFGLLILAMLALDLGVFHRKPHAVEMKEALSWSAVWLTLGFGFAGVVYWFYAREHGAPVGREFAAKYVTGYLIEKSLSVDNIFVFWMIFSYFAVPAKHQHKILFWGILGALAMRAIMILAGIELLERFAWMIFVFGAFLVLTGLKMALPKKHEMDPAKNPVLKLVRRFVPVAESYDGDRFFVRRTGKWVATPLFVVLVLVEATDLVFAVDSIPAILAISPDPFIVYTSNVFAILGLRALFFAVGGLVGLFHYLQYALAVVLVWVGGKLLWTGYMKEVVGDASFKVPTAISLGVVVGLVALSIAASLRWPKAKAVVAE